MIKRVIASASVLGIGYWTWRFLSPQHSVMVLENKVVIITGASSGVGEALAEAFARRGARIVLAARREDRLQAVLQRIAPYAADVLAIPTDITDPTQRQHLIDETLRVFGQIDVLVNNAGVSGGDQYELLEPETIEHLLAVNLVAPMLLTRLVLAHMRQRNEGYIVNVGSGMGRGATPYFTSYSASKFGLSGFSDSLRRELLETNIRVTYVTMGWTRTEMLSPEAEAVLRQFPQFDILNPDTVAESVVEGVVQGRYDIYATNWIERSGIRSEKVVPRLMDWYWRFTLRYMPWLDLARKAG